MQIQSRFVRIAAKHDVSSRRQDKIFSDNVLKRQFIHTLLHRKGAVHLEFTLVIERSLDVSASVYRDIVSGAGIHQDSHGGTRCDVQIEVYPHVAAFFFGSVLGGLAGRGRCLLVVLSGHVLRFQQEVPPVRSRLFAGYELDELIFREHVRARQVIHEDGVFFRPGINIHVEHSRPSLDTHPSGGNGSTAEQFVAELFLVVRQQLVGLDVDVVAHVREMLVAQHAIQQSLVAQSLGSAVLVVNHGIVEYDFSRSDGHLIIIHVILRVQDVHFHAGMFYQHVAFEVDTAKRTEYAEIAGGASLQVGEDSCRILVQEVQIGVVGRDVQVESAARLMSRSDGTLHARHAAFHRVVHQGIQENGMLAGFPSGVGVHGPHRSQVEREVLHVQICFNGRILFQVVGIDTSGGIAVELHGVEVDHVEHILQIDVLEIGHKCVVLLVGNRSVNTQIAVGRLVDQEVVNMHRAGFDFHARRMNIPHGVVDDNAARVEIDDRAGLLVLGLFEERADSNIAGIFLALGDIPVQVVVENTVADIRVDPDAHHVFTHFSGERQSAVQESIAARIVYVDVFDVFRAVNHMWGVHLHLYQVLFTVERRVDVGRLLEVNRHVQDILQCIQILNVYDGRNLTVGGFLFRSRYQSRKILGYCILSFVYQVFECEVTFNGGLQEVAV